MIERCKPEKKYGKLGVTVCERWRVFANFLVDMGERPKGSELDRRNPLGNYTPDNTRWRRVRLNRQYRRTTKLDAEARRKVRKLRLSGLSYRKIGLALGVSTSCVEGYISGRAWGKQ